MKQFSGKKLGRKPLSILAQMGRAQRYENRDATLYDCQIELEDSHEKGYLVVVRAIRIRSEERRVGKECLE